MAMTDIANVGFPHIAVLVPCYNEELAIPALCWCSAAAAPMGSQQPGSLGNVGLNAPLPRRTDCARAVGHPPLP